MSTITHVLPGFRPASEPSPRTLDLPSPPLLPTTAPASGMLTALPMFGGVGGIGFLALGPRSTTTYVLGGCIVAVPLLMVLLLVTVTRRRAARERRATLTRFLRRVDDVRDECRRVMDGAVAASHTAHPPASSLAGAGCPERPWRLLRIGTGRTPSGLRLPEPAVDDAAEPLARYALRRLRDAAGTTADMPMLIDLSVGAVSIDGPPVATRDVVRAMVLQAAATEHAARLAIAVVTDDPDRWAWVRWLPHCRSMSYDDPSGPARLVTSEAAELGELLRGDQRDLLVILDSDDPPDDLSWISTDAVLRVGRPDALGTSPGRRHYRLEDPRLVAPDGSEVLVDRIGDPAAEIVARSLLGSAGTDMGATAHEVDLPAWLGLRKPGAVPCTPTALRRPGEPGFLRVPIGAAPDRTPVLLDLKEAAYGGTGPHGLVIGSTGSGKSELLRSLVIGLIATHHPDDLQLMLVDFKGGASFQGVESVPHVAGTVTNLEGDDALIDRIVESISGELERRQRRLRAAPGFRDVPEYQAATHAGADLAPLPTLLIVIDEFSELLSAHPEVIDLLVQIGRVGRSLGVHLLLAAQRIDEGRLRGLESHLSYRLCLRTFGADQSRAVIGVPDAAELPAEPGHGYLREPSGLRRFRSALSGARWVPAAEPAASEPAEIVVRRWQLVNGPLQHRATRADPGRRFDDVVSEAASTVTCRVDKLWLPPLDLPPTLDQVGAAQPRPGLRAVIGWIDRPRDQRIAPLELDLAGAGGHIAVVGGPRSGKSVTVTTIVAAIAMRYRPDEVQVVGIDHSNGGLANLAGLPHVSGIAAGSDDEMVDRLFGYLSGLLMRRDIAGNPGDRPAEAGTPRTKVVVVIDGLAAFRQRYERHEPLLMEIATRGLAVGIHLAVTASRWFDVRPAMRDQLGSRIELRLGDPLDSVHGRGRAATVPADRPGRCLAPTGEHALIALPRSDGVRRITDLPAASRALAAGLAAGWDGPTAPRFPRLPGLIRVEQIPGAIRRASLVIGVEAEQLRAVALGPGLSTVVMVGERASGRTSALRALAHQSIARADLAPCWVVDPRGSLAGIAQGCHGYARTAAEADALIGELPDGPALLLIDDYDLIAGTRPMTALIDRLPFAAERGLRVVLVRDTAAGGRLMIDPLLAALTERGAATILLSGRPEHGAVSRLTPRSMPKGRARLVIGSGEPMLIQLLAAGPVRSAAVPRGVIDSEPGLRHSDQ